MHDLLFTHIYIYIYIYIYTHPDLGAIHLIHLSCNLHPGIDSHGLSCALDVLLGLSLMLLNARRLSAKGLKGEGEGVWIGKLQDVSLLFQEFGEEFG